MRQLALLLAPVFGVALGRCPLGSVQGLGLDDCFKLSQYADTWYGAEEDCRSRGGHLTSVSSAFSNVFLRDQCALWRAASFWLGASQSSSFGLWTWSDGTKFSYTNWAPGEPGKSTAHCLAASTETGQWSSQACYNFKPYICKLPAAQEGNCSCSATRTPPTTTRAPTHSSSNSVTCPQVTCPPPPPPPTCPPAFPRCDFNWTYIPMTKECWTVQLGPSDDYNDWPSEVNLCATKNSTAISIHSPEANQAAAVFAQANNRYNISAVWLGLHVRKGRIATWQWVDDSPYNYANWSADADVDCSGSDCYVAMSIVNDLASYSHA